MRFRTIIQLCLSAFVFLVGSGAYSQTLQNIEDFAGTYSDGSGSIVEIVADGELFAVLEDAKYPLTLIDVNVLKNASGELITFQRDNGVITSFDDKGQVFRRTSPLASPLSRALARPRPIGPSEPANYTYSVPQNRGDGIPTGDIADTNLGRATATRIVTGILNGEWRDVHSVLLFKDGKLVLEEYFYGYDQSRTHQLRSATKSVVSAMVGVALQSRALRSVNEPVLAHMRYDSYSNPDQRKPTITIGNLMTMQPGFDCNDHSSTSIGRETLINEEPDWVKATLDLPMITDPGKTGTYCSGGVAVTGRMVENAMGKTLPILAQEYLFTPLGIRSGDWRWNYNLDNSNREYSQIHLRPRDMLKFGVLYSNGGVWHGRRILPRRFVRESLSAQSDIDGTRYGYFWWNPWIAVQTPEGGVRVDYNAAQGNGGQKIYLFPQYNLVAVITAGAYNRQTPSNSLMAGAVLPLLARNSGRN